MSSFAIKYPFFVLMMCLIIIVVGITTVVGMPVDLFPEVNIPVVVVATFYAGMPPQQIESNITNSYERFFTLGSGIDHIESRSLPGVSLIKIYFQSGTDANAAVSNISNLAMANLRRLPPGTLPPVVLKFDASNLPVCLITLKGQGLNETQLKDLAQFSVRNQVANVPGASVPQPYGGRYRQIMVYVDPVKLEAHQMSVMDVVHSLNESNLILPAGDVRIGPKDYNIYANSQVPVVDEINDLPLKTVGNSSVMVADIGEAKDSGQLQTNIVRVDGQRSVYIPVLKQGGKSNTITIVNGVKRAVANLLDIPKVLKTNVVFDQSVFVKIAVKNVINEGTIGLVLTALMILLFLGNLRATVAVLLSIPISCLATFLVLNLGGSSINTMVLGGLALALSRLIDNSVVVLENIFRHMEMGEDSVVAAERGGKEVQLAVLAGTVSTCIVFFPVVMLYGVSKYLFTALALAVVIALFASYVVAMTVVPLFCARFIRLESGHEHGAGQLGSQNSELTGEFSKKQGVFQSVVDRFNRGFHKLQSWYEATTSRCLERPALVVGSFTLMVLLSFMIYPFMGKAFFPRTDPGQFVINVKVPAGTRIELTNEYIAKMEQDIRSVVIPSDLNIIVSNIGITPDLSAIYTSNSGMHTAFIQVSLKEDHKIGSYVYMEKVRQKLAEDFPDVATYFQAGGLVDSVVNQGKPAPIDIQIGGNDLKESYQLAQIIAKRLRGLNSVSDVLVPQDLDYPGLELNINREHAALVGVSPKDVVDNVITALTSDGMIAPSFWVDPVTGNSYMLTVQYPETQIKTLTDFMQIPLRSSSASRTTPLDSVADIKQINTPTEVDHYQLRRVFDIYVMPKKEDLSVANSEVNNVLSAVARPEGVTINVLGAVRDMQASFSSFAIGLVLAVVLVYLILMAQFASFSDPLVILLAVPPGISGVLVFLLVTRTTLNVMSLMGGVMMTGIAVSNSILIVEFVGTLHRQGMELKQALIEACKVRLRPILMTSLATILGLIPMALALEPGSEQYAPLARAILGGLTVSVAVTIFLVPAAYLLIHHKKDGVTVEEA
ncbi:efflux RND transporter permease subunit [Edaphobacter albus]|uniref:efflux RND transporter permease subunit n=1 Tax=Edaphobacter sp. 4G125 TaxID=2763071 RepID=UPI001646B0E5|nr:efflux RND transporter permease subunit [Edaphobacter sp. 4G125]QNI35680.1 efflux RND transporter permease subunit [Edaphobacter sp. 4G125]